MFRNRETGEITIAQFPNVALWLFLAAVGLRLVVPADSSLQTPLDLIASGALGWWAIDEIVRGVNPWRRFLGGLGVCFALVILLDVVG